MGEKRVRRTYPSEFEAEAVRLADSIGIKDAARRSARELEAEVVRLRWKLANAKLDKEILRKAATYFARESR